MCSIRSLLKKNQWRPLGKLTVLFRHPSCNLPPSAGHDTVSLVQSYWHWPPAQLQEMRKLLEFYEISSVLLVLNFSTRSNMTDCNNFNDLVQILTVYMFISTLIFNSALTVDPWSWWVDCASCPIPPSPYIFCPNPYPIPIIVVPIPTRCPPTSSVPPSLFSPKRIKQTLHTLRPRIWDIFGIGTAKCSMAGHTLNRCWLSEVCNKIF